MLSPSCQPGAASEKGLSNGDCDGKPATSSPHPPHISLDKDHLDEKRVDVVAEETSSLASDEHVITTGQDVSDMLISDRDDGDACWTLRSVLLSLVGASFQAVMTVIYRFKPTQVDISSTFLVLLIWALGVAWAKLLPTRDSLERRYGKGRLPARIVALAHAVNPGPFGLKEHVVATIAATSASGASQAIDVFTTQKLFYPANTVTATTAVLGTVSISMFGYGLAGFFRPILVYPSQMVFWSQLPTIDVFQVLHWGEVARNARRTKIFWFSLAGMGVFEVFPAYIAPWLNSISVPCLAAIKATGQTARTLTNVFGGSNSNEGLGLLSVSLDWQYITSSATSLPLKQQGNAWIGIAICYVAMAAIYYSNTWSAKTFPFMSTSLFSSDGSKYPQNSVFVGGVLDRTRLAQHGFPSVAGTYAWGMLARNLAIGGMIAHVILFWGRDVIVAIKQSRNRSQPDRHWIAMQRYRGAPWWWYAACILISFVLGLVISITENTTLQPGSYMGSLAVGSIIAPFSAVLYAILGNGISTNQLVKMVAGVISPGRPLANLYFYAWSHEIISQSINFSGDLKLGQYLKIPPRTMFVTQVIGTIYGAAVSYAVMTSIVSQKLEVLLDQNGSSAWSGAYFQSLNASAVTWSLAKYMYGSKTPYFVIPMAVLIGMAAVVVHWIIHRRFPTVAGYSTSDLVLPTVFLYSAWLTSGQNCIMLSTILVGVVSQVVVRTRFPRLFRDYNYLVGAGLDGGALIAMFVLSFAVLGAAGRPKPFPTWFGNADGYADHCPKPHS
ncbi:uncharacterized protein PFL1_02203 [Pseudozyma flocculosa PF-1]|uniref:uncharacterized protein n=1 Tax=Pseudozyma flocculosa PF-1 TaxID=1277687 RepID=UPI0004560709|nr:uncharacterized protein PFL1_02203 [Pseudozyma flocculosa PF-1]EPQ30086.1 hypothetical protein PFL1_02203 [Pseudozyma flocculosa PF-1]